MTIVRVRYFAAIRETLGSAEQLELPPASTVAVARDVLIARGGAYAAALARGRALRAAVNQTLCDEATVLADGAELAFFPPVTGG